MPNHVLRVPSQPRFFVEPSSQGRMVMPREIAETPKHILLVVS